MGGNLLRRVPSSPPPRRAWISGPLISTAQNAPASLILTSPARACLAPPLAVTPRSLRSRFRALASCPLRLRLRGKNHAARSTFGGTMRAPPRALATPSLPSPITGDGSLRHDPRSGSSPIRQPVPARALWELQWRPHPPMGSPLRLCAPLGIWPGWYARSGRPPAPTHRTAPHPGGPSPVPPL